LYEKFYGLSARCFSKTPDPSFLYQSKAHAEALARMLYAVEEREIMLLTGEIGSGKTTLSRAMIDSLDESYRPMLIVNPRLTPGQLLRTVAFRLGAEKPGRYKSDLVEQINDRVYALYEEGICPVIILDEAQLIPGKDTFEEIRLLTNYQLDDENLLSLMIIGQTELRARIRRPTYEALRQRIGMAYHLGGLNLEETRGYIAHRLKVAGREEPLFTDGAIDLLYGHSEGIPRIINALATGALLTGFGAGAHTLDEAIVEDAAKDLGLTHDL
jgi:type II secretory pathway predicted ATPase ExeA